MTSNWCVYIIRCSDDSLYTGITTDVEGRFRQHLTGRGARYFRGRSPVAVVYREDGHSRSSASRTEARIKKMRRQEKDSLIARGGDPAFGGEEPEFHDPVPSPP